MSVIDEVKQRIDIAVVIGQYVTLTKAGRTLRALCPFHTEKTPSFFVYPDRQSWHCFGACSTGGDVFSFIMKKENIDFGEALRLLAQRAGVVIPDKSELRTRKNEEERLFEINDVAVQFYHDSLISSRSGEKAREYLDGRGLSTDSIISFKLGLSLNSREALKQHLIEKGFTYGERLSAGLVVQAEDGNTYDRFRNRLMIPIKNDNGRTIGFGARALDNLLPKYINSPATPLFVKSDCLFGVDLAKAAIRKQDLAVVVEGYMDVIMAHQYGFKNVIASMGTSITDNQASMLKKLTKNIVLALDPDAAGEEAMLRWVDSENIVDSEIRVAVLPVGKDPDDVIKEDATMWQYLIEKAVPAIDYAFKKITDELDLSTTKDQTLATGKLLPIIARIKDDVRCDSYLTKLSKLTGTTYKRLESALKGYMFRQHSRKPLKESRESSLTHAMYPLVSSPQEEYCLALLLRHPELKEQSEGLLAEYFDNSENREIFLALQKEGLNDPASLRDKLDAAVWEHLEVIAKKEIPAGRIEQKYNDCILSLRKRFLQNLEIKKAEVLLSERETGGTAAELAKQEEQGIEVKTKLLEVFIQKTSKG